jgi:hypothetical protein
MPDRAKAAVLDREVYVAERYKRFGDLTATDADLLADQLSGHSGGGLERTTTPVALAWRQLARRLEESGASSVSALDPDEVERIAQSVRVVPPGGSWL